VKGDLVGKYRKAVCSIFFVNIKTLAALNIYYDICRNENTISSLWK